jgi:Flp pilus assembly protein TadG
VTGERGSVTAWLLVLPLLLLLLGGIGLDLWAALAERGRIAAIADDAAAAGATAIDPGSVQAAEQVIALDPALAVERALVAVDTHPGARAVTSRHATASDAIVSVTVEGELAFLLLRLVGADTAPISVTGHASPVVLD